MRGPQEPVVFQHAGRPEPAAQSRLDNAAALADTGIVKIDCPPPYTLIKPGVDFEEFLRLSDEDTKADLIGGELIVHSPASTLHEQIFAFLLRLLAGFAEERGVGVVLGSRLPIRLSDRDAPEPDLMFVERASMSRLKDNALEGAPEFIVEIGSPSTQGYDLGRKKVLYLQHGVREYWVVDAENRVLHVFRPGAPEARFSSGRVTSAALAGFWLETDWLWQNPLPPVARALHQILSP